MTAAFDPSAVPPFTGGATGDPEPLVGEMAPERPYPLDALPARVRAAVLEHQAHSQQPTAMVALSAISALSLAAQAQLKKARKDEKTTEKKIEALRRALC
jgi:hypothetical protein